MTPSTLDTTTASAMQSHHDHAVLIDLDGTLVDSAPDIVAAANRMLAELGAAPLASALVTSFIGNGVSMLVQRLLRASPSLAGIELDVARHVFDHHYRQTNGSFSLLYPGVVDGLDALQLAGFQLGCVTNKPVDLAHALLATFSLTRFFSVVVGGDSLPQIKPDPAPLLHACTVLGVRVDHTVMVGDSQVDIAASNAAGMRNFIVRYGYPGAAGLAALAADTFIDSLCDVAQVLQQKRRAA